MASNVVGGRLRNIRVAPGARGWFVELGFVDDRGRQHIKAFPEQVFLAALKLLSTPNRNKRFDGLTVLGATTRRAGAVGEVYLLKMDDDQIINLGDPHGGPSGGNDILMAVHENSLRPNEIRQALLNRHPHSWDIRF